MSTNVVRDVMNRYHLTSLLRVVLGSVFIFSAVVKGIDPYGTVLKIGEYFNAFGVPILVGIAEEATVALVALEMWLGVALLTAAWPRLTIVATFVVQLLFTLLTLVLAIWNPVSECGCFGDVVVMTNWQTFAKNVVLVVLTLIVGWCYDIWGEPKRIVGWRIGRWTTAVVTLVSMLLVVYALVALPLVERFPFGVGTDLREIGADQQTAIEEARVVCRHKVDGHEEEFAADDSRWWNTSEWEFVRMAEVSGGGDVVQVSRRDFGLYDGEDDATAEVVATEGVVELVCIQQVGRLSEEQLLSIGRLTKRAEGDGERVVIATASSVRSTSLRLARYGVDLTAVEILNMDITTMQVLLRAPAGVVRIEDGVIVDKRSIYTLE